MISGDSAPKNCSIHLQRTHNNPLPQTGAFNPNFCCGASSCLRTAASTRQWQRQFCQFLCHGKWNGTINQKQALHETPGALKCGGKSFLPMAKSTAGAGGCSPPSRTCVDGVYLFTFCHLPDGWIVARRSGWRASQGEVTRWGQWLERFWLVWMWSVFLFHHLLSDS